MLSLLADSVDTLSVPLLVALGALTGCFTVAVGFGAMVSQLRRAVTELDSLRLEVRSLSDSLVRLSVQVQFGLDAQERRSTDDS